MNVGKNYASLDDDERSMMKGNVNAELILHAAAIGYKNKAIK